MRMRTGRAGRVASDGDDRRRARGAPHPRRIGAGPRRSAGGGIAQLPWRRLVNPFRPVEILSADQVEAIHVASLRILSEIGLEVPRRPRRSTPSRPAARWSTARPGGSASTRPRSRSSSRSPRHEFTLHARNPERTIVFGGANLVFWAVGGPAFVSDLDRGRRAGNARTSVDYVRLIGALDVIHQEGGGPLEPTDLPVETRHLDMYRIFATELDKTWQCLGFGATPGGRRARASSRSSAAWTATRSSASRRR